MNDERMSTASVELALRDLVDHPTGVLTAVGQECVMRDLLDARAQEESWKILANKANERADYFERERDEALDDKWKLLKIVTDKNVELLTLQRELIAWRAAIQRITPGGSEFMDPESVERWAQKQNRELGQAKMDVVKLRRERDEAGVLAAVLAKWLHRECVMSGFDLDGGSVQEKLLSLGFAEMHLPEPGSPEEEEFGQDQVLCYLKPEWAARTAGGGGDE